jgi:hypothetical protein
MDSFGKLMFATTLKRVVALAEWLTEHQYCEHGPHVEVTTRDPFTTMAHCSCGASYQATVVVSLAEQRIKSGT